MKAYNEACALFCMHRKLDALLPRRDVSRIFCLGCPLESGACGSSEEYPGSPRGPPLPILLIHPRCHHRDCLWKTHCSRRTLIHSLNQKIYIVCRAVWKMKKCWRHAPIPGLHHCLTETHARPKWWHRRNDIVLASTILCHCFPEHSWICSAHPLCLCHVPQSLDVFCQEWIACSCDGTLTFVF